LKKKTPFLLSLCLILFVTPIVGAENAFAHADGQEDLLNLNGLIPETASESTNIEVKDGMTQPIYSTDDVIFENLFVETTVDSDGDGNPDQVEIEVMRPNTESDIQVPVIFEMSPYRGGSNAIEYYDIEHELYAVGEHHIFSDQFDKGERIDEGTIDAQLGSYGDYYIPRGYAVILGYSIGAGGSTGCPTTGGENEILGTKAVIDWLNGNARAFTEDGEEVMADWSTGNVGMIGVSYNGTLPNGVATTGVEGLQTIIPIASISSWYDYYRANGAVSGNPSWDADLLAEYVLTRDNPEVCDDVLSEMVENQDRKTGDYNDFWEERNYVTDAGDIEASVFVVHGLNDWNTKTKHFSQWWEALSENDVERKLWLHQGEHETPNSNDWQETQHRWFDYWLYGIDNGITDEPIVDVEREDGTWHQQDAWPEDEMTETTFHLKAGTEGESGILSGDSIVHNPLDTENFFDNQSMRDYGIIGDIELSNTDRLTYLSPVLTEEVRISGTPEITIEASIDRPVTNLTVLLVDYDGENPEVITRGWMDPQNLESSSESVPLTPNQEYSFTWDMQPHDYVFEPGNQIGIVIDQSDWGQFQNTIRPEPGAELTVIPALSGLSLPIVGDDDALTVTAGSMESLVERFEEEGEFENQDAAHSLKVHLASVNRYENQEDIDKVIRHMEKGFKYLLDHQLENEMISEGAYNTLMAHTDYLIKKWR
jgi:X-Pro dipeptidyl-peptidase